MSDRTDDDTAPYLRRIRSFVLREGRMTPAQQRAFDEHWARFGIDYSGSVQDYAARFGRSAPLVMEIGFGQADDVRQLVEEAGLQLVQIRSDLQGIPRVVVAIASART